MNIGQKIKELRKSQNMSVNELAQLAGYKSRQSIYELERKTNINNYKLIEKIAKALNVDTNTFIKRETTLPCAKEESQPYGEQETFSNSLKQIEKLYSKALDENEELKQRITILEKRLELKIKKSKKSK
jgi:transcriptional regulator with XRE-family HTH domain